VRKDPEVLSVKLRDITVIDWILFRLCYLLYQTKDENLEEEIIRTLASIFQTWNDGSPSSWNELKKCSETLKSYISCNRSEFFH